jgi:hypothetical protein
VAEKQLASSEIAGALIDQRDFRPSEAVRTVPGGIEPYQGDPLGVFDDNPPGGQFNNDPQTLGAEAAA